MLSGDPLLSDFGAASFYPLSTVGTNNNPNPLSSSGQNQHIVPSSDSSMTSIESSDPLQSNVIHSNNQYLYEFAQGMEKFEVRAFGCLIDDLVSRIITTEIDNDHDHKDINNNPDITARLVEKLRSLQHDCCSPDTTHRPRFDDIVVRLNND